MNRKFVRFSKNAILFSIAISTLPVNSAWAKKKTPSAKGTSIPIPENVKPAQKTKNQDYFENIAPRIMNLVENGSPKNLKVATMLLHRTNDTNYSEAERTLLQICTVMSKLCWSQSQISWDTPENLKNSNYYTNVLFSVQNGIYDKPSYDDYLALLLPCLSLFTSPKDSANLASMENSLKKALTIKENSVVANYLMGILQSRLKKSGEAAFYFEKALAADGENKDLLLTSGNNYIQAGEYQKALACSEKLIQLAPQSINAMKLACNSYYGMKDWEKASDYAAKILTKDSTEYEYLLIRAEIALAGKEYTKTSSLLDAYSRSNKTSKKYYLLKAQLLNEWNKNNAFAAETIGKALLEYPEDSSILLTAAKIASDGNMKVAGKSALEFAKSVLKNAPGNTEATKICITELAKSGNYTDAYSLSSKAIENTSTSSLIPIHIDICLALSKNEEALVLAKKIYSDSPDDTEVQKSYLKTLVSTGKKSDAEAFLAELLESSDSSMKSFLYYQQSFLAAADEDIIRSLRSSLTQNPRNSDSLFRLYQVYYNRKDWKRAQYYLKQVVALNPSNTKALAMSKKLDQLINN